MTWKTIFQTYKEQEIVKKVKQVPVNFEQVSQFSLFLPSGETKKLNSEPININQEILKIFLEEDWNDYKDNQEALELWADLLLKNQLIEQGKVPNNFTAITYCGSCGYVYVPPSLVNGGKVLGCPWCWNRIKGFPVPKIQTG